MKKKFVLGSVLVLTLVGGALAACSTDTADITETLSAQSYEIPAISNMDIMPLAYTPPTVPQRDVEEYEQNDTEIITHIQLPASLLDSLQSEDEQIAFWEDFRQNYPDVYHIEFYDENGDITMALVTQSAHDVSEPIIINDLYEALSLHRAANLTMPTYLPEGFVFEHAWFSSFSCPISNPDSDFTGGQLFVVFGDGEQSLTLEIRYHPEYGGFDTWTACENLEEIIINGRNAIVGDGGLSIQVTSNARYTFMTWAFAGDEGSTISNSQLIRIAESIVINS